MPGAGDRMGFGGFGRWRILSGHGSGLARGHFILGEAALLVLAAGTAMTRIVAAELGRD